ncbi:MAG: outer membrane lipoprotein-sorting protein [Alteromonadaceae bacterium]|jgi:outer membrane lipoprotein-sorting protein
MQYLFKLLIITWSLLSVIAHADDLVDANAIITKANLASYYSADDGSAQARMVIVDAQGNKQMRQFTILRKDQADLGDQDMLVFFSRPTDVKDTVFRVVKKVGSDDDRWLYLPALDLVKRISAGDKRTSFVGAHFFYEDVSGRNPAEDNFTLLKTDNDFYQLKAIPKDKNSVEFDHYIVNIDKRTFLPMKVDYFNSQGKQTRSMEVLKTEVIDGFTTVMHSKISQHSDGSYTEMQFRDVKYNLGLPNSIFSERSLRNPPKAWLK